MAAEAATKTLNINVGILGHVDSGKTTIAKALSTTGSTAAFDKNPQSQERGITLDLGFSCFTVEAPERFKGLGYEQLQITLVDCPGHASLIRTIIGGAQIIDFMVLVIDVTKGIQTQTAECLVIGEISWNHMIVVLNKIDLFPADTRAAQVDKVKAKLAKTFQATKFKSPPMIAVAANPGESEGAVGIADLARLIVDVAPTPNRKPDGPLVFAVDHCFPIKGQGTVMTGTVLSGTVRVGDTVDIPSLKIQKKVKSMQMFRRAVESASQGDRVGVCVTQFDSKLLERGLVAAPAAVISADVLVAQVEPIRFFKLPCESRARFHLSVGYHTVMATATFFCDPTEREASAAAPAAFDFARDYLAEDLLYHATGPAAAPAAAATAAAAPASGSHEGALTFPGKQYALLELDSTVFCLPDALLIASRLDTDIHAPTCRLAFTGRVTAHCLAEARKALVTRLRIVKHKQREGVCERLHDSSTVIARGLFKKETPVEAYTGLRVSLSTGEQGVIEGGFGQTGKFKIRFMNALQPSTAALLAKKGKKGKKAAEEKDKEQDEGEEAGSEEVKVILNFKRYLHDETKKMVQ